MTLLARSMMRASIALLTTAVVSCSLITGPSGPSVYVSFETQQPVPVGTTLYVDIAGRHVTLPAPGAASQRRDAVLEVDGFGARLVRVALVSAGADTLAVATFARTFERDVDYGIGGVVSRVRPLGFCIDTVIATPVGNSARDTLFVTYGGLPKGSIC